MWIKICGNTNLDDAEAAVAAGANALGFVFAPSPRQVSADRVAGITARLPQRIERYGVFVAPTFDEVVQTVRTAGLSGVQLHTTSDPTLPARLREHFSAIPQRRRLGLLKVLHFPAAPSSPCAEHEVLSDPKDDFNRQLQSFQTDHSADAVLIDSRTAIAPGGTGVRFDWAAASGAFLKAAPHLRIIVAGGLSPQNVAEAIATMRPWGVDVVTGVEAEPGRKDHAKVREFIARARATARALASTAYARA
jgi:phosphoribosylanthranilate isomerase